MLSRHSLVDRLSSFHYGGKIVCAMRLRNMAVEEVVLAYYGGIISAVVRFATIPDLMKPFVVLPLQIPGSWLPVSVFLCSEPWWLWGVSFPLHSCVLHVIRDS